MDTIATHSMHDWSRYIKTVGLSMPQFGILMHLFHHGRCGMSDISDRMEVTNAGASQLVERLVQNGLLERSEDPHDRRAKRITLTDKGRNLIKNSIAERFRWVESLVAQLTDEDQVKVLTALPVLLEAALKMDNRVSDVD